ncbi:glycerol kinase [Limosa lapponica baueri]|uniref:Glycerol kinase n=1 Tax=Limosa lapponica baueri TaxID=1758121 RepID=A0A2I0US93_LIMLA|nr:glycerol kinase [Limosa lapponica baueri]
MASRRICSMIFPGTEVRLTVSGPPGRFDHPDTCWRGNTGGYEQSRRFLKHIDDNFLTQVIEKMMRGGTLLDLRLKNKEELFRKAKFGLLRDLLQKFLWDAALERREVQEI